MSIRPARPEDQEQVLALVTMILNKEFLADSAAYATDDLECLTRTYAPPENLFLIAEEKGSLVGTCGVKADGTEAAILRRLFVDPGHRRQGIGENLLKEALAFCRRRRFKKVIIRTSGRMEQAIRLCRSLGFEEDGSWGMSGVNLVRFRLALP